MKEISEEFYSKIIIVILLIKEGKVYEKAFSSFINGSYGF